MNKKTNWSHWFWGLFFLVCAVVLVASKLGLFSYHVGFWTLILTLVLAAAAIKSVVYFSVAGTIFSLTFICMLYAKPLGITSLVPWTLLGAALLFSIGLSLVLQPLKRKWYRSFSSNAHAQSHTFSDTETNDYESLVNVNVHIGSAIRYVQSTNFQSALIHVKMGDAKVYFDHAEIIADHAVIELTGSIGDIDLYIPKEWNVQTQLNSFAADTSEKGLKPTKTGPKVTIMGNFSMGDITIHYI
ncbi:LiaF transmembrane domain-containing protein [Pediococcus cellicola]|uniref:Uncharacterized protein n=1 Tax=Pediococcus cellicola TaxID=319652 RepID=A0A0R2IVD7_9LACO|nr:LiaF domain-containing protein [Pediococcus cellicola]KRN66156.1 hypothetical protein IV80_GL001400 [Pediococcus cellicola]GEL15282.1 hypothetical protein PCE01_10840 [Pediococcus cellicola]